MKLSEHARRTSASYKTVWRCWQAGQLDAHEAPSGTIMVREAASTAPQIAGVQQVTVRARVSAAPNRPNLESQVERLTACCGAKGYQARQVVKEVGSGVNESCPKFLNLLADPTIAIILVEHKVCATRFGFRYLEKSLEQQGGRIEVVNLIENGREDLVTNLVARAYSFCARLYGQRRAKRKTTTIVKEFTGTDGATDAEVDRAPR